MFKVGDKVKIKLDKVLDKYKKYNGVYRITEKKQDFDGKYIYKVVDIPDWATDEMLEKVEDEKSNN